jgi:Tol biopolymer transport system component
VKVTSPGSSPVNAASPYRFENFRHDNLTGANDRVSVPCPQVQCGTDTNGTSGRAEISADGRYVAFTSSAENLIADDHNRVRDVFVRDMVAQVTTRVDVPSAGDADLGEANQPRSEEPGRPQESGDRGSDLFSISADGRYVVFKSASSNLVRGDTNGVSDVFIRDRVARTTTRVNVSSAGEEANHQTKSVLGLGLHTVSDDGRYVFFNSNATNLVSPPTADYLENVYRRDLRTGTTTLVTVSSDGKRANRGVDQDATRAAFTYLAPVLILGGTDVGLTGLSYSATPDGRYVVYNSDATNLVPGDSNAATDIFLSDLGTRTTTRVSVSSKGEQVESGKNCGTPSLSDDARFVVFDCSAENLVEDDDNAQNDVFVRELPGPHPLSGWY